MNEQLIELLNLSVLLFAVSSMLSAGLGQRLYDILLPLRNVGAVLRAMLANFVLVPMLALFLVRVLDPPQSLAIGLFLAASAAGAPFLIKLVVIAEADVALSTALLLLLLPLTIIYMPVIVPLALPAAKTSAWDIAQPLLMTMLLPLGLGMFMRAVNLRWSLTLLPWLGKATTVSLLALIITTLLANLPGIVQVFRTTAVACAILLIGGAFVIGYVLGGPSPRRRIVLGLGTSQRNISAAAVVASQALEGPQVITMVVVTSLVGFAILFPIARFIQQRPFR